MEYKNVALKKYLSLHKPRQERFTAVVESVIADGTEEVFDLTEPITHSFVGNSIVVHNCAEQPLSSYSACNLGAVNLSKFYDKETHDVAWERLTRTVRAATRFLDNVIDASPYPLEENNEAQLDERRVGLGIMGLAELMILCGIRYGSEESIRFIDKVFQTITENAYRTSIAIAKEKGAFLKFDAEKHIESGFIKSLPQDIKDDIVRYGIRNVTLTTIAPTGSIGSLVNTSTGVEPYFSWTWWRTGRLGTFEETAPIAQRYLDEHPEANGVLPDYYVNAMELSPLEHVAVQAAAQKWVDSAISKTVNCPADYTVDQVSQLYMAMYDSGCKGGTIYRDGSRDIQVLNLKKQEEPVAQPKKLTKATRPKTLNAKVVKGASPYGTVFITISELEDGTPFEVFITVGKGGSDIAAEAESIGRLLSLSIQSQPESLRKQLLGILVEQLIGIGGARPQGLGKKRVMSLPDAIGKIINEQYLGEDEAEEEMPEVVQSKPLKFGEIYNTCPECGNLSFIRVDGCSKCEACGHSEC